MMDKSRWGNHDGFLEDDIQPYNKAVDIRAFAHYQQLSRVGRALAANKGDRSYQQEPHHSMM